MPRRGAPASTAPTPKNRPPTESADANANRSITGTGRTSGKRRPTFSQHSITSSTSSPTLPPCPTTPGARAFSLPARTASNRNALRKWVRKAHESAENGATVVCLPPARTDAACWHDYVLLRAEVRYIRGRLKFNGSGNFAPFPSAIVTSGPPYKSKPTF